MLSETIQNTKCDLNLRTAAAMAAAAANHQPRYKSQFVICSASRHPRQYEMRFESVLFRSLGTPWAPPFYLLSTPLLGGPDTSRISYLEEGNATTISILVLGTVLGRLWGGLETNRCVPCRIGFHIHLFWRCFGLQKCQKQVGSEHLRALQNWFPIYI